MSNDNDSEITWLSFDEGELPGPVQERVRALIQSRDMWRDQAVETAEALGNTALELAKAHRQLMTLYPPHDNPADLYGHHSSWSNVSPIPDPTGRIMENQLCYVDGYMLGIDDTFKVLNAILQRTPPWDDEARELAHRLRKELHGLRGHVKGAQRRILERMVNDRTAEA